MICDDLGNLYVDKWLFEKGGILYVESLIVGIVSVCLFFVNGLVISLELIVVVVDIRDIWIVDCLIWFKFGIGNVF